MKILKSTFNTILLVFLIAVSASAQKGAIKAADKAFNNKEYYNAIELYKKALSENPGKKDKPRLIFQVAECYRLTGDLKHEEQEYDKAVKNNYDDAIAILYLADAQIMQAKYDDALANYQQYQQKIPSDPRGANGVKSCQLAQQLINAPTRYVVTNMAQLNTKDQDFSPAYSDRRMDELIFTSTRPGTMGDKVDNGLGQNFSDIFITKLDKNGKFSAPVPLPAPVNTPDNEGAAIFDKEFKAMYFTRCTVVKNKGEKCKIFATERKGNNWDDPIKLAFQVDSNTYAHPAITPDGQVIVFTSDIAGGQGGHDLWLSRYDKKTKTWGDPQNLGASINTAGEELYPYINADGSLYYSSDGLPGMGGLDIFHAAKLGDGKWGNPTNLGSPINSEGDDFGIVFEGTKDRGYLSSNRPGGKGSDDIYSFYLPPILFAIEGTVYDIDTHKGIPGASVRMVGSDGTDVLQKTDTGGHYMYGALGATDRYVKPTSSYILSASAIDLRYLNGDQKANITTVGKTESFTFKQDFELKKPTLTDIHFSTVLYDLDKSTLKPESKDSLNILVKLLNNNPTLKIELDAHTDQQGSEQHNMPLSQARAKSCISYLISQGIDSARLVAKGWGFTRLIIPTSQIMAVKDKNPAVVKHKRDSLYQINRRTVFQILSWSYVPKGHVLTQEDSIKMKAAKEIKITGQETPQYDTVPPAPAPVSQPNTTPIAPQKPSNNAPAVPQNNAIKPKQ